MDDKEMRQRNVWQRNGSTGAVDRGSSFLGISAGSGRIASYAKGRSRVFLCSVLEERARKGAKG